MKRLTSVPDLPPTGSSEMYVGSFCMPAPYTIESLELSDSQLAFEDADKRLRREQALRTEPAAVALHQTADVQPRKRARYSHASSELETRQSAMVATECVANSGNARSPTRQRVSRFHDTLRQQPCIVIAYRQGFCRPEC